MPELDIYECVHIVMKLLVITGVILLPIVVFATIISSGRRSFVLPAEKSRLYKRIRSWFELHGDQILEEIENERLVVNVAGVSTRQYWWVGTILLLPGLVPGLIWFYSARHRIMMYFEDDGAEVRITTILKGLHAHATYRHIISVLINDTKE